MDKNYKRKLGDKRDGRLISGDELDTNHFVMPLVWPRRSDNEAYINEIIDISNVDEYLNKKKIENPTKDYSFFMIYCAACAKTFINRPRMNRFIRNGRLYERYKVSIGFITKKGLTDDAEEALSRIYVDDNDTFDTLSDKIRKEIEERRSEVMDKSSDDLRILMKFPHFVGKWVLGFLKAIDKRGPVPESVSASDIFFTSIAISHLGSIGLNSAYHHLSNWGTNSFFTTIGKKQKRPFYNKDGSMEVKDSIDIGWTIDERIADGLYYAKTIKLIKRYIKNPSLLDKPFKEESEKE